MAEHPVAQSPGSNGSRTRSVFGMWVEDRIILAWAYLISFLVLDSFFTYLGTHYLGAEEKNMFVSLIFGLSNGWVIWLILKIAIAALGLSLFFLVYYWVSTSPMSEKDRQGVLLLELCGWIYLVSLNVFSVLVWSGALLGRLS